MKNAIIFHGTGDAPDNHWYGWLGKELQKAAYKVEIPNNPKINQESLEVTLKKTLDEHSFDEETVLVGHSAGGPLILSILENIEPKVELAIIVAGYCTHPDDQIEDPILQSSYDWRRIKDHAKSFVFINSVNDPWSCDDKQGRMMFDKLGGTQIIKNEGHFGSGKFNQKYSTFPLLRSLVLGIEK